MSEPPRKRARLACVACNARRVKCDVTDRQPCANCVAAGNVVCETRESKRGKHPRKPRAKSEAHNLSSQIEVTPERHADEVAASHVLASLSSNFHSPVDTSSTTHAHNLSFATPSALTELQGTPSQTETPRTEDDTAVYLGESSSLRYVTDEHTPIAKPTRPRLRHAVPSAIRADAQVPEEWEAERRRTRIEMLRADDAFSFPPSPVRVELLKAYFRWFHPHFAILDEADFWTSHQDGTVSPLLLQALLFIGIIHCEQSTVTTLGWGNRHRAKWLFYIRAKDIYDATCETNKITVIQALFLMSFWRAGALLEKDARHWLGTAISLAQTRAYHRSAHETGEQVTRLKRRLWWAVYVRERQCGSALGLPNRIRDVDCDIEPLTSSDFAAAYDPSTPVEDVDRCIAYSVAITQLAIFIGKIVDIVYLPNRTPHPQDRTKIRDELYQWKDSLPLTMQLTDRPNFQAAMLHLAYNNLLILLYRTTHLTAEDTSPSAKSDGAIALQAAARNSRIVEDMLPSGQVGHAQMHVITNLFNTLCIHVAHLRNSTGINRTLAEHRAKLCLLGLQELQKTWEVTNWVLQMFFQYLDRSTAARLAMEADDVGIASAATQHAPVLVPEPSAPENGLNTTTGLELQSLHQESDNVDISHVPLSWTTDEANQYLFSQIENDFAFGEGSMLLQWSPSEMPHSGAMLDFGYTGLDAAD